MFWVLIRSALECISNEYQNICFCGEIRKYLYFLAEKIAPSGAMLYHGMALLQFHYFSYFSTQTYVVGTH